MAVVQVVVRGPWAELAPDVVIGALASTQKPGRVTARAPRLSPFTLKQPNPEDGAGSRDEAENSSRRALGLMSPPFSPRICKDHLGHPAVVVVTNGLSITWANSCFGCRRFAE